MKQCLVLSSLTGMIRRWTFIEAHDLDHLVSSLTIIVRNTNSKNHRIDKGLEMVPAQILVTTEEDAAGWQLQLSQGLVSSDAAGQPRPLERHPRPSPLRSTSQPGRRDMAWRS
jgi:hypothetical protein